LGPDRYALETTRVREILPVVEWKQVPQAANGILGVFNYHGEVVSLVDLSQYIIDAPARLQMSTRIVWVEITDDDGEERLLGLLAEGATVTFRAEAGQFAAAGVEVGKAPYLGPVMTDSDGMIQLIDLQSLLPVEVKQQLLLLTVEQ